MESLFASFLESTEKAGLPEGDYLKVMNSLKKVFEESKKEIRRQKLSLEIEAKDVRIVIDSIYKEIDEDEYTETKVNYRIQSDGRTETTTDVGFFQVYRTLHRLLSLINANCVFITYKGVRMSYPRTDFLAVKQSELSKIVKTKMLVPSDEFDNYIANLVDDILRTEESACELD